MDIVIIASFLISFIASILVLNKYRKSERIAMYILIQFILWFVNSIYVFLSMLLMHAMFRGVIDDITIYAIGYIIGIYLVPVYAFCIICIYESAYGFRLLENTACNNDVYVCINGSRAFYCSYSSSPCF